ncbi:MAG: hypothetical protein IPL57_04490 [Rubrivivax sp.]|nr:hypothetical protein [Rubrivivax sp.]
MANSGGGTQGAISLDPQHAQRLYQAVPDLDDWPRSWHVDPADIPVGQQIVQVLTPFLLQLLDQGLAKTTLRRHRDNLWTLGGELIRCRYDDDELARKNVKDALLQLIEDDGGPLMCPRITEPEQDSLDATCRKLNRFLHESAAGTRAD